ncbi:MAG: hypothetical protein FD180_4088 [Planctomycetota bacterium]|nr:MAG: hypothetical protein FD180_4088 [Planctomycetota bacterium]
MKRWNAFWFATTPRHSIGAFRIILCAWFVEDFLSFLPGLDSLLVRPGDWLVPSAGLLWMGRFLPLLEAGDCLTALRVFAWILAPLALLGIGTRFSLIALALVNFLLRSWHSSSVYVSHASILPSLALFVLALAPGVRAWSVDALLEAWRSRRRGERFLWADRLAGRPAAVWPIHLILAAAAVVYVSAGVAKLRWAGGDWLSGRTLQWYLQGTAGKKRLGDSTQFFVANRDAPAGVKFRDPWGIDRIANSTMSTSAGRTVGSSRALCAAFSWATLALELGFAFLFVLPRAGQYALLAGAAAFHAGIGALMGIDFGGWAVLFLAAVDWNSVLRRAGEFLPGLHASRAA